MNCVVALPIFVIIGALSAGKPSTSTRPTPETLLASNQQLEQQLGSDAPLCYTATFLFRTNAIPHVGTRDLKTHKETFHITTYDRPPETRGLVSFCRSRNETTVTVRPTYVAPEHKAMRIAAPFTYHWSNRQSVTYSGKWSEARSENAVSSVDNAAELDLIPHIFGPDLRGDWFLRYLPVGYSDPDDLLRQTLASRQALVLPANDNADAFLTESVTIPHMVTALGPLFIERRVAYEHRAALWLPVQITLLAHHNVQTAIEINWQPAGGVEADAKAPHAPFPSRFVVRTYLPKEAKPGSPDVLMRMEQFDIDPSSVKTGPEAAALNCGLQLPAGVAIKAMPFPAPPPPAAQSPFPGPSNGHLTPLILLGIAIVAAITAIYFWLRSRRAPP